MNIQLRKIKFYEKMSEETNAFSADLYIDGKNVGDVRNDGHGGCTDYRSYDVENRKVIEQAETYCLTLPPLVFSWGKINMNLEHYIDELFNKWLKKEDEIKHQHKVNKAMKTGFLVGLDLSNYNLVFYKKYTFENLPTQYKQQLYDSAKQKCVDGNKILNTNLEELGINL